MTGKIIKGIAGFYYVHTEGSSVYECKAKGIFRNQKIKPLVGDNVELEILDEEKKAGFYCRYSAKKKPADSSCCCKCRSGVGNVCHKGSGTEPEFIRPVSDFNGKTEASCNNLFQ